MTAAPPASPRAPRASRARSIGPSPRSTVTASPTSFGSATSRTGLNRVDGAAISAARARRKVCCRWMRCRSSSILRTRTYPSASRPSRLLAPGRQVDPGVAVGDRLLEAHLDAADRVDHVAEPAEADAEGVLDADARQVADGGHQARRSADRLDRRVDATLEPSQRRTQRSRGKASSPPGVPSIVIRKMVSVRSPPRRGRWSARPAPPGEVRSAVGAGDEHVHRRPAPGQPSTVAGDPALTNSPKPTTNEARTSSTRQARKGRRRRRRATRDRGPHRRGPRRPSSADVPRPVLACPAAARRRGSASARPATRSRAARRRRALGTRDTTAGARPAPGAGTVGAGHGRGGGGGRTAADAIGGLDGATAEQLATLQLSSGRSSATTTSSTGPTGRDASSTPTTRRPGVR